MNKALRRSSRRNNRLRNFLFGGAACGDPDFCATIDEARTLLKDHKNEDLERGAEELYKDLVIKPSGTYEHGVESMKGGMDPSGSLGDWTGEGPSQTTARPNRRPPQSQSMARLGQTANRRQSRAVARRGRRDARTRAARAIVERRAEQGVGPHNTYVQPQDTRPIWNPDTHGEMVKYWHRIFKYSFKTLFMIVGTNSYVATGVGMLTVGQLFGTLDKLLITIVSVVIGTTCAGVATYTGAAAATIALYTLIKTAYDRVAGQPGDVQWQNVAAAQCSTVDQNIRGHVIDAGQDLVGLFNSPGFLELASKMNSGVDFASGACAGLLTSKFIRRTYRPPLPPDGSPPHVDPWTFAIARRLEPTRSGEGSINLFDKWDAVSIPVIFPVDKIEVEEEGRTRTMAFLNMGRGVLSFPQQFQAERELSFRNLKIEDLRKGFHRHGIDNIVNILGMYVIEGLYEYLEEREIDLETVSSDDLIYEINTFLSVWEDSLGGQPIPEELGQARDHLLQQQQQPELEPEIQQDDGNL
jgi:hypothetical protein